MNRERTRAVGHEIQRVWKVVALTALGGGGVTATVGMFACPAIVGFGQGRGRSSKRVGGVDRQGGHGSVGLVARTVVGACFLQKGVLFQLLLDEGGEFQVRKLQELDRLLQLRRHSECLARGQNETRTDTHGTPTPWSRLGSTEGVYARVMPIVK